MRCVRCTAVLQPDRSTDSVLCFQLGEGAAAASPGVPVTAQGSVPGREGVGSGAVVGPRVDPSPRGSLPCPMFHQGLFVRAAL